MQKVDRVLQVNSNDVAQKLVFGCVLTSASAQALGFETQKGAQRADDVVALSAGGPHLGFFHPAAITFTGKYGFLS